MNALNHPMGSSALIGYTGLVGSNLTRQFRFDSLYNSSNISYISKKHYDFVVCSGVSGTKWIANKEPEKDQAAINSLLLQLQQTSISELVLISTVDVYPNPQCVTENSPIHSELLHAYGKHRLQFEKDIVAMFPLVRILRLPAIYGWNLRKNALYDLMHKHELEKINPESIYQFYWLEHLWRDLMLARKNDIRILNLATEPLGIKEVAHDVFGIKLNGNHSTVKANYDFRTCHDSIFQRNDGYLYDKTIALDEIRTFVQQQRLCKNI